MWGMGMWIASVQTLSVSLVRLEIGQSRESTKSQSRKFKNARQGRGGNFESSGPAKNQSPVGPAKSKAVRQGVIDPLLDAVVGRVIQSQGRALGIQVVQIDSGRD